MGGTIRWLRGPIAEFLGVSARGWCWEGERGKYPSFEIVEGVIAYVDSGSLRASFPGLLSLLQYANMGGHGDDFGVFSTFICAR